MLQCHTCSHHAPSSTIELPAAHTPRLHTLAYHTTLKAQHITSHHITPCPGGHRADFSQFEKLGINCEETYTVEGYETSETIVKSYGLTWER